MRSRCLVAATLGWLIVHSLRASAQTPSSTLRGRVQDAQHAAVPGATVNVIGRSNGVARTVSTDENGEFTASNLPPGVVDVAVTAKGFTDVTRPGVVLEVGQIVSLNIELAVGAVKETVSVVASPVAVDTSRSVVDAVIPSTFIDALPLNGRNFLELSLLVPGNAPAPNFDPTKSNTVTISSAGQLGRGGNITIDGADNNDDVVGGPLQNVSQEAVQEFQIATNRFSAESGRSASSAINVVTRSGSETLRGSTSIFARDSRWQALPPTFDRSSGEEPPFDRQQVALGVGGPVPDTPLFWFGAIEYRNQDGATLVGSRDAAARTIRRSFAAAPLDDLLGSARIDWHPRDTDSVMVRYAGEKADDTSPSTLDRAIGSASYRQASSNRY